MSNSKRLVVAVVLLAALGVSLFIPVEAMAGGGAVPLPGSLVLLLSGIGGAAWWRRRR